MKTKKLYVSTTNKPITRAKIWKLMADDFAYHWMDEKWFLLKTETKLLRISRMPESEEVFLDVFLEESQRDPGNLAIVARAPRRDTVVEIRKEMDPKIGAVLAISLAAAVCGQQKQFSLKEEGFFFGNSLIVDLSHTKFLTDFLSADKEEFLKTEERLADEKDRVFESSLMPLYREHWSHFSDHGSEGTAERICSVTDTLFGREEMKEILRKLNELDEQIIPYHVHYTENLKADQAKLRAWNQLYQDFLEDILEADETAETNFMNLYQPPFYELMSLAALGHQNGAESLFAPLTSLKEQKRNLLIYRLNGTVSPAFPDLIRLLRTLSGKPALPADLKSFEQRSRFLDLLKEMSLESMETRTENLEQAAPWLLNLLLTDFPEDNRLEVKQVLMALASVVALSVHNQRDADMADAASGNSALQNTSAWHHFLHTDWSEVLGEPALMAAALTACCFSIFADSAVRDFGTMAAIRFFEILQEPERLQRPLTVTEMIMLKILCSYVADLLTRGENRFWFIYTDQKQFDDEQLGQPGILCKAILDWMEKYASLHDLGLLFDSYPVFWSLVHGEYPDPEETEKFQNLFTDWARKNPQIRRQEMLQIRLIPVFQPDPVLVSSQGVDYIFLSALEMIQADLPVNQIPGGIQFDMNLLCQSLRLLGKGLHSIPAMTFDKIIYSLNFQWDLIQSALDVQESFGGKGSGPLDGPAVLFHRYCKTRIAVLTEALFPVVDLINSGSSAGTVMAVQVSRILDWFMEPEITGRLNSEEKMEVIEASYYLGRGLTSLNFCDQAEIYLRFTESVLLQKMAMDEQLSIKQMSLLIDTQVALIINAVQSGSEESRAEAAAKLIRFLEMEQKKGRKRDSRSFLHLLNAYKELAAIQPYQELIKETTAVLLQTEKAQKNQFTIETIDDSLVHQFLQGTMLNLMEAASASRIMKQPNTCRKNW